MNVLISNDVRACILFHWIWHTKDEKTLYELYKHRLPKKFYSRFFHAEFEKIYGRFSGLQEVSNLESWNWKKTAQIKNRLYQSHFSKLLNSMLVRKTASYKADKKQSPGFLNSFHICPGKCGATNINDCLSRCEIVKVVFDYIEPERTNNRTSQARAVTRINTNAIYQKYLDICVEKNLYGIDEDGVIAVNRESSTRQTITVKNKPKKTINPRKP